MALIKGICKNFGECDLADNKEVQEVDKTNFVCEECGKPLYLIEGGPKPSGNIGKGPNKTLIAIIAGAVLVVAAIGGGTYALMKPDPEPPVPTTLALNHTEKTLKVGEVDTLTTTITPDGVEATLIWKASKGGTLEVTDGIVKALKEGAGKIRAQAIVGKDTLSAICNYIVETTDTEKSLPEKKELTTAPVVNDPKPTSPASGSLRLSYGTYTGQIKNGYPNGQGRLVYSRSRQISKYDNKNRMAQPGDVVQGTFKNGFFTVGKHFDSAGNMIEMMNIGVAEDVFEQK